jgi:hypothetical protein
MRAQSSTHFGTSDAPGWVSDWLQSRGEKAQKKEEKQRTLTEQSTDPEAALKSARARWKRLDAAVLDLQRWLADQINGGLGVLGAAQRKEWEVMAARLVDAQAPGLASRVREAALGLGNRALPPETLLKQLGLLQLACDAVQRRESLPALAQADIRTLVGWPVDKAEVIATSPAVDDRWIVLGHVLEERDNKVTERRVWLHGESSQRRALLLEHAHASKGFERAWINGTTVQTALAFYPGAGNLRALAVSSDYALSPATLPPTTLADEWQHIAQRIAASPWVRIHPVLFSATRVVRDAEGDWCDCEGQRVPLSISDSDLWALWACSGGHPVSMAGEWDGAVFRALSASGSDGVWQRTVL